jgi:hypothetical protein
MSSLLTYSTINDLMLLSFGVSTLIPAAASLSYFLDVNSTSESSGKEREIFYETEKKWEENLKEEKDLFSREERTFLNPRFISSRSRVKTTNKAHLLEFCRKSVQFSVQLLSVVLSRNE